MAYGTISDDTRQPSDRPREYMGKAFGSGFVTAAAGFALLGTFALTAVYATPRSQPALDARVTDAALSDTVGEQWVVYKQALPVTNAHGAWEFVSDLICPSMGTPTNLGCGGLKTGCKLRLVTFFRLMSRLAPTSCHHGTHANADTHPHRSTWGQTPELHFVESSIISAGQEANTNGVEYWENYFKELNGDMSTFNAFMDNKVSLWVPDLSSVVSGLKNYSAHNSGFGYMTRQSSYSDGITVGHVLVPVEARVIELVGDISILDEKDRVGFDS